MKWLAAPTVRAEIAQLCRDWMDHNRPTHVKLGSVVGAGIAAVSIALTIPFHPTLEAAAPHMAGYALAAVLCLANLRLALSLDRRGALTPGRASVLLTAPAAILTTLLAVFMATVPLYGLKATVFAHFLVVLCTAIFMHRYWREQYALTLIVLAQSALVGVIRTEVVDDAAMIAVAAVLAWVTAFVFRREFFASLYDRSSNLSAVLPPRVARYLTLAQTSGDLAAEFAARERYTACVCSDWRDFQRMARDLGATGIAGLFEEFYDIVFRHLDTVDPDGRYFVDWTADELFVVFYADADGHAANAEVLRRALRFAEALATKVHAESRACSAEIAYDIGVAAGYGVLGLIGPRRMKKTTNASFAAGAAKRLEGEAKAERTAAKDAGGAPYLALEAETWGVARANGLLAGGREATRTARAKDIAGRAIVVWQGGDAPAAAAPADSFALKSAS